MSNGMDVITVENVADAQAVAEMMQASGLVEYAYPDVEVKATRWLNPRLHRQQGNR